MTAGCMYVPWPAWLRLPTAPRYWNHHRLTNPSIRFAGKTQPRAAIPPIGFFIHQAYVDIGNIIFSRFTALPAPQAEVRMFAGTGRGESFFTRYFVWHLLQPPSSATQPLLEAIYGSMIKWASWVRCTIREGSTSFKWSTMSFAPRSRPTFWIRGTVGSFRKAALLSNPESGSCLLYSPLANYAMDILMPENIIIRRTSPSLWSLNELIRAATDVHGLAANVASEVTLSL